MTAPPCSLKLRRSEKTLELAWADGVAATLSARELRCSCRCASCVDEVTGERILDPATVPLDLAVQAAEFVGQYALKLSFSDGHETGLYTWEHLRSLAESAPAPNRPG